MDQGWWYWQANNYYNKSINSNLAPPRGGSCSLWKHVWSVSIILHNPLEHEWSLVNVIPVIFDNFEIGSCFVDSTTLLSFFCNLPSYEEFAIRIQNLFPEWELYLTGKRNVDDLQFKVEERPLCQKNTKETQTLATLDESVGHKWGQNLYPTLAFFDFLLGRLVSSSPHADLRESSARSSEATQVESAGLTDSSQFFRNSFRWNSQGLHPLPPPSAANEWSSPESCASIYCMRGTSLGTWFSDPSFIFITHRLVENKLGGFCLTKKNHARSKIM